VNVTVVSMLPPAHAQTIRFGGSSSRTSQRTVPSKPRARNGRARNVKRWPTAGLKSLGMNHADSASLEVSAAQARSAGYG
jgi:hypothetical protein